MGRRRIGAWNRNPRSAHLALLVAVTLISGPAILLPTIAARGAPAATISFEFWGDPAEAAAYETMVEAFTALHPEVAVQTEYVPNGDDFYARLATGYAAGDAPDVFLINYRRYGQFAAAGALEPIAPYLDQSAVVAASDYYPAPMAAFTFDGELMCLPQNLSSLVVYYNRDLFDAAAITYPAADWAWDDFLSAALALSQDTDGDSKTDQFGIGIEPSLVRVA
ncbi:MAG: extracellular solute-binding protein, partial [Chloroflexota bacterium]|nr:extracellular solute-binding protein [Chloroflexota bacterium]